MFLSVLPEASRYLHTEYLAKAHQQALFNILQVKQPSMLTQRSDALLLSLCASGVHWCMCCLLSTENMVHQHHTVIAQNITALYVKLVEKRTARPSLHTPTADNGLVCWNVMPAVYVSQCSPYGYGMLFEDLLKRGCTFPQTILSCRPRQNR